MSFRGEETLPASLATLVRQLDGGGADAPPDILSPVAAAQELKAVSAAVLAGRGAPYKADCASLKIDLQQSFGCLGPASKTLHATVIDDFRKQVARLDDLVADGAGARVLHRDAEILLRELGSDASLVAAFDDAVAAFESGAFVGRCETRLRYLKSVVEAAGHDWLERARRLHDALAGSYSALDAAAALDPPHVGERLHLDEAGLSVDERLWLCRTILPAKAKLGPVVVWLVYANAFVAGMHVRNGPVEFYDSRIWPAVLDGKWPGNPGWTQPPELAHSSADLFFHGVPDQDFAMVRVSLDGPVATARARARSLARAALELTGWQSDWVLMEGECAFADDWFGSTGFTDPRERALNVPSSPMLDPAAHVLDDLDSNLLERLAAGDEPAAELLADTRWRRTITGVPDAEHRVALVVALFERALVPSAVRSDKWYGACQRCFELLLSFDDIERHVRDAGDCGVHAVGHMPDRRDDFLALERTLIAHGRGTSYSVRLKEVIRAAAPLRAHLEPASMEARMLKEVEERTRDGAAAAAWVSESRKRFERLLARTRRQRNAITHGTRTVPAVLETVEPFLDRVAGRLIGALHYCVAERRDLTTELQSWRVVRLKRHDDLAAGGDPEGVVWS